MRRYVKGNALHILESGMRTETFGSNYGAPFLASRSDGTGLASIFVGKNATVFTAEEEENL